jgi:phosphoglycerate dehydrogenase-like enzyme
MSVRHTLIVLDGLFEDLDIESRVAAEKDWAIARWDGSDAMLHSAEAVVHVRTKVDRAKLEMMPACRVVGRFGTGLDSVDQDAAREYGIHVVGVRDYCIPELTSHTLALAFALDRRVDAVRRGRLSADASWQEMAAKQPMSGRTTATVIGFGSIGSAVTRALIAVGITVRVVTAHGAEAARRAGAAPTALDEALGGAGFIFLHAALDVKSAGMIDAGRLAHITPGAILVNTARIGLIDENAVAAALDDGRISGLGLDAMIAPESPLRAFLRDERMLLTPHVGWYSARSAAELRRRTVQETIDAFHDIKGTKLEVGEAK